MGTTLTTNYSLIKPNPFEEEDTWGSLLNTNWDSVDTILFGKQAKTAATTALAALTPAADEMPYFTGASAAATTTITALGRTLLAGANAAAMRTTLGLGTADSPQFSSIELGHASDTTITRSAAGVIEVEGGVVPKENRANTFSADQTISANLSLSGTFTINNATQYKLIEFSHSGTRKGYVAFDNTNNQLLLNAEAASSKMLLQTANTTRMTIDASGNIGIGTSSIAAKLDVRNTADGTIARFMRTGGTNLPILNINVTESTSTIEFEATGASAGPITFKTGAAERLRIDSSGNVGIGKTAANGLLDVNGVVAGINFRVDQAYPAFNWYPSTGAANQRAFRIQVDTGNFSIIGQNDSGVQQNFPFQIAWGGDITFSTNALVKSSGSGLGYGTGSGGSVTQATSKTTGVTINKANGQIITAASAMAAGAEITFTVSNTCVAATDVIDIHRSSGGGAGSSGYTVSIDSVAAGSFVVYMKNLSAVSKSEAITINFAITKATTS